MCQCAEHWLRRRSFTATSPTPRPQQMRMSPGPRKQKKGAVSPTKMASPEKKWQAWRMVALGSGGGWQEQTGLAVAGLAKAHRSKFMCRWQDDAGSAVVGLAETDRKHVPS